MAIDPLTGMLIGGGLSALGGYFGAQEAKKAQEEANRLHREQMDRLAGIELPSEYEELYRYTPTMMPELVGQYTPEMEQLYQLTQPSALEQIEVDPRLRLAQMQALEQVGEISRTGLTPADQAALDLLARQTAGAEQARQSQIAQEMAQRGIAGSGAELALRAASAQAAAARQQEQGLQQAQLAGQRQLQATGQQGSLAGQMRGQEFGEAETKATAKDVITRFNLQQQQESARRNLGERNRAAALALAERQRLAEARGDLMREQERRRADLPGTRFNREVQRAGGQNALIQNQIQGVQTSGAQQAGLYADVGSGLGKFFSEFDWGGNKEDTKKDTK